MSVNSNKQFETHVHLFQISDLVGQSFQLITTEIQQSQSSSI